jgi:Na+/melibiose symporter-like transporter
MTLLRRLLKAQAALWTVCSAVALVAPRWLVEDVLGQPTLDVVWIRTAAVMGIVLALVMVLVAQRIDELWWWAWAFAILDVGTATLFAVHALLGPPEGAEVWPWWLLAALNGAIGAGLLVGMATAGQEKPFV